MRNKISVSTVCYLIKDDKILMLKFHKKWGQVYAPPGGKANSNETPTECIIREFYEETNLKLIDPKLKGISYWVDSEEGIIFIYIANDYEGELILDSVEGKMEWVSIPDIKNLKQFDMNSKFTEYLFQDGLFEGHFILNDDCSVKTYSIKKI